MPVIVVLLTLNVLTKRSDYRNGKRFAQMYQCKLYGQCTVTVYILPSCCGLIVIQTIASVCVSVGMCVNGTMYVYMTSYYGNLQHTIAYRGEILTYLKQQYT